MELCELLLSGDKVKALANALLMQEGVPWRQFCILQLLSVCFFYHAVKLGWVTAEGFFTMTVAGMSKREVDKHYCSHNTNAFNS